jgi:hypothetical protein
MDIRKSQMCELLIDLFDRINVQTPSNFVNILNFCYETITEDEFNEDDIAFAFIQWIDSK